jgi:hypothetical protein
MPGRRLPLSLTACAAEMGGHEGTHVLAPRAAQTCRAAAPEFTQLVEQLRLLLCFESDRLELFDRWIVIDHRHNTPFRQGLLVLNP